MVDDVNNNWVACDRCGSPVMKDPRTGQLEPCSNCLDKASPTGFYLRATLIAAGIIGAYVLRQQGRGRGMKWALIGSVVLSAVVVLLAERVTTDREVLRGGTGGRLPEQRSRDRGVQRRLR